MDLNALELSLVGKRAIVCGSTQGIGRACAVRLADLGAQVILVARDASALDRVCASLNSSWAQSHEVVVADFRSPSQVNERVGKHLDDSEPVEILVNNTGGPPPGSIVDQSADAFHDAMAMHLECNHRLLQVVLPGMKQRHYGRVINILSTSVREPIPRLGVSNATRWAVAAWAKTAAGELAPFGITVNNLLPGFTNTSRLTGLIDSVADSTKQSPEVVRQNMVDQIPAKRIGEPHEIAALAGFLASPSAAYITGTSIAVDGGRTSSM